MLLTVVGVFAGLVCGDEIDTFIKEILEGTRSDSERSAKLMEAFPMTKGNEKLQIALLEEAVEYGMKSLRTADDCSRVQKAASLLLTRAPEKKSLWLSQQAKAYRRMQTLTKSDDEKAELADKIVDLYIQAGHSAAVKGDWKGSLTAYNEARTAATLYRQLVKNNLVIRVSTISSLSKAQDQVARHIETLTQTPDNTDARANLIKTLLVTLDDPISAAKYTNEDVDQKLQTYVPMAGKSVSELPFGGCRSLGEWYYKELAKSVIPLDKYRMIARAKAYYERALSLYGKSDISSAAMKHQIAQMEAELIKLSSADPLACVYCFASEKTDCPVCMVKSKSTGKMQCVKCSSTGRMKCPKCDGKYGAKCPTCNGRGYSYYTSIYSGNRLRRSCSPCLRTGKMHYDATSKRLRYGVCSYCSGSRPKGSAVCSDCSGGGGTKACPKCDGEKTLRCTHCR